MKIVNRYILKEFFPTLLLGLFVFIFVLLLDKLFALISLFLTKKVGIFLILRLFYHLLPSLFSLTLPMSTLFALLFTFGHLSEHNEIAALQISGIRIRSITLPPLFLSLLFTFLLIPLNQQIVPQSEHYFKKIYAQIIYQNPEIRLEEKNFWTIGEYRLWIEKIEKNKELKNITIYQFVQEAQPIRIVARKGKYRLANKTNLILDLEDGNIQYSEVKELSRVTISSFKNYTIVVPLEISAQALTSKSLRELKSNELAKEIKKYREQRIPTSYLEVEYHLRIVLAATCFIFALVAIPLGIELKRGGRAIGFGVSLLIIFFYYLLIIGSITISEKGILPAGISLWIPNFLFFGIGGFLFYRLSKY